jgi:hypothetical protein
MKRILFTQPNFLLTIDGEKTNTRRLTRWQNTLHVGADVFEPDGALIHEDNGRPTLIEKPRYKVGERLYLAEPYHIYYAILNTEGPGSVEIYYPYTDETKVKDDIPRHLIEKVLKQQEHTKSGVCNKMFMPEWAARYHIVITGVRSERLQDISDEDCIAEGIIEDNPVFFELESSKDAPLVYGVPVMIDKETVFATKWYKTPRKAYAAEIDMISGKGTWKSNPYVFSYYYELFEKHK